MKLWFHCELVRGLKVRVESEIANLRRKIEWISNISESELVIFGSCGNRLVFRVFKLIGRCFKHDFWMPEKILDRHR